MPSTSTFLRAGARRATLKRPRSIRWPAATRLRGLRVVGVDVLESARKAAVFRSEHDLSYPVVIDTGPLRNQYEINGLPVHVFIDRGGVVRKIVVGELSPASMRANIEAVLR